MFWHYLALAIGGATVEELQARMSSPEYARWQAYFKLEPFGMKRTDLNSSIIATVIAGIFGGDAEVSDFMPDFIKKKKKTERHERAPRSGKVMSDKAIKNVFWAFGKAQNEFVKRKQGK